MLFANFSNVFFLLLLGRPFCSILAESGLQRGIFWGPFSQISQILHEKKCAEIEARKVMTFGGLLGGAGGGGRGLLELITFSKAIYYK